MPSEIPQTFCVLPWIHRYTDVGGEIQVCCSSSEYQNSIVGEDGHPMSITNSPTSEEVLNSDMMKSVRMDMVNGKWPTFCDRCRLAEESGASSRRTHENYNFSDRIQDLVTTTEDDGKIPVTVRSFDYRLGNACNLACRMCSPRYSSKWERENNVLGGKPATERRDEGFPLPILDWQRTTPWLAELETQLPTLDHIHFAGGEPLISSEMKQALQLCVDSGHAEHIALSYNTNMAIALEPFFPLWEQFRGVNFTCSIDGFGPMNDFIRHPSIWSEIDQNMRRLDEFMEENRSITASVSCTVQIYNVFSLEPLFRYMLDSFRNIIPVPTLSPLVIPEHLSISILPRRLKWRAALQLRILKWKMHRRLQQQRPDDADWLKQRLKDIDIIIAQLKAPADTDQLQNFASYTSTLDSLRSEDVLGLVPELRSILKASSHPAGN